MEQIDNYFGSDHLGRIPLVARLMAMLPSAPHVFDGSPTPLEEQGIRSWRAIRAFR